MQSTVTKRNGDIVDFDLSKIENAIKAAGTTTGEFDAKKAREIAEIVTKQVENATSVERIQDLVEDSLIDLKYKSTAKAYIIYREQHKQKRHLIETANVDLVGQYLDKSDWRVNENSNMSYSLQGLNNYLSSEISKSYWLSKIYEPKIREAHASGEVHLHDLNLISVYCVGWDLYDLLTEGFRGVEGKVEAGPAKHFRSVLGQIVNFFYTLQGEAAGAQAFSNLDTLIAPFIRYDNLNYDEVKQAIQEFLFNVNVPTRVGFQTPFTNVTLDLTVPSHYVDMPVIIGGEPQDTNYGDYQEEMDTFNQAFLEVMGKGDAKGRVFTFPIPTYNITEDFDWESERVSALWDVTAKYGLPYFSNFVNSDMSPEDARSMCCRLRIDNRQLESRGGGLFGANPLTGSVGVVTVNLPRIGLQTNTKEGFLAKLFELMDLARDSLEVKRKTLEQLTEENLYPYTRYYLRNIKMRFGSYWKNHFSTIGIVGMNEALQNCFGQQMTIATPQGASLAEEILDAMRERLIEYQTETGNNYNLEATPAEGTTYRLASLDQKQFPNAIFANGVGSATEFPFYTNSTHLPVNYTDDIFEVLDLQDNLQTKYTGGTVIHFFVGEKIESGEAVKSLVRTICNTYKLPYFTITPTFSVCPEHGYIAGEHKNCPDCESSCEVYSRVVGYLRPTAQWNNAKQVEFEMRAEMVVNKYNIINLEPSVQVDQKEVALL